MRHNVAASLVVMCAVLFLSCDNNDSPLDTTTDPGTIVPLKVGNQWVYRSNVYDASGSVIDSFLDTVKIVRSKTIGTETWYEDNTGRTQTNRADGRWLYSDSAYLVEKYPAKLNDTYSLAEGSLTVRVRSLDESVQVSQGSHKTHVYSWTRFENATTVLVGEFFHAPRVGLIRADVYSATGGYVSSRQELLSVTLQ